MGLCPCLLLFVACSITVSGLPHGRPHDGRTIRHSSSRSSWRRSFLSKRHSSKTDSEQTSDSTAASRRRRRREKAAATDSSSKSQSSSTSVGSAAIDSDDLEAKFADALQCKDTPADANGKPLFLTMEEYKYARCPPGDYLEDLDEPLKLVLRSRLRKAICSAKARGWSAPNPRETHGYAERGYATFESAIWPKPPKCKTLIDEGWSAIYGRGRLYRPDYNPEWNYKLINHEKRLEFHLNWKVASSSFPDYLKCEFGSAWSKVPVNDTARPEYKVTSAVREPIGRFISAASELLERAVNQWCPSGPCGAKDFFDPEVTLERFAKQTTWYNVVRDGYSPNKLRDLMKNMVSDTACNYYTYAAEHFTSQATFVTQNSGPAANVDHVVKLEQEEMDLKRMTSIMHHPQQSNCKLTPQNTKAAKPNANRIPSDEEMMKSLASNSEVLKDLCLIYAQDFLCFNYELPEACNGLF